MCTFPAAIYRPRRSFAMLYPNAPIEAIDLMNKLLQFNPQKRISAEKALEHAYVATFHNPEEETVLDSDVIPKLNDNYKCGVDKYRARLYEVSPHLLCSALDYQLCVPAAFSSVTEHRFES